MSSSTPAQQAAQIKALIAGLTTAPPAGATSLVIAGVSFTVPELVAKLTGYQAAYEAEDDAEAVLVKAVQAREAVQEDAMDLTHGVHKLIKSMLGRQSAELEIFGIKPEKDPAPLTVEQKAAKAAKAKATRAARHTMGPKQKAKIHGSP